MPIFVRHAVLLALSVLLAGLAPIWCADATERLGLVLLHGKGGMPQQLTPLAATLGSQGFLTEQPEMCWSRGRIYDQLYLDCLKEIDAAVDELKGRGATSIVVLGMSLGGNGALGYGARHPGLKGIITLVPGHAPEFISRRPEIVASLERARPYCRGTRQRQSRVQRRQYTHDDLQYARDHDAEHLRQFLFGEFARGNAGECHPSDNPAVVRRRQ